MYSFTFHWFRSVFLFAFFSFQTDFMGMKECFPPGWIPVICAYPGASAGAAWVLFQSTFAGMVVHSLHGE